MNAAQRAGAASAASAGTGRSGRPGLLWSGLMLVAACALLGCSRESAPEPTPAPPCPEADAGTPVDKVLVAFLGKARAAHHSADLLEDRKDLEGAIRLLDGLLSAEHIPERPEAQEVVADTRARLADLKSELGRFDDAAREVDAGMALVKGTTYYRGHLLEMRGLVHERHAKHLRDRGDLAAAKAAEDAALEAFEASMRVQQQVIDQALPDAGPR